MHVPGAVLDATLTGTSGPAVVQLHGLASSRTRDHVVGLDTARDLTGVRLLRYDARGHGRSGGRTVPEDYAWDHLATDLLTALDQFFPGEQVYGAGTSMGLGTVLHAAVREPDRFCGLTLQMPPTAWETRVPQRGFYLGAATAIEDHGFEAFVAPGRNAPPPPAQVGWPHADPDMDPDLAPSVYRGAALSDLPDKELIAGITVPVTILSWTDDPTHPQSSARLLDELIPQAKLNVARTPDDFARWPDLFAAGVEPFKTTAAPKKAASTKAAPTKAPRDRA
ncbi:MAG: alpha/beta fold hydrolase [Gordonia sp. (in: high G+C Gram-positive bacteria)]